MDIKEFISQFEGAIQKRKYILIIPESFSTQFTAEQMEEIEKVVVIKFVPDDYLPTKNTIYMMPPGFLEYKIEGELK